MCGAVFLVTAKDESIQFSPELNNPYGYEVQLLINSSKNEDYPVGYVQMLMKVDYSITFINKDFNFYLEVEGLKGFMKPSLIRNSSSSFSKTIYFNTYDSLKDDHKKVPFLGRKFLISAKKGISMADGSEDVDLDEFLEKGIIQPLIQRFQQNKPDFLSEVDLEKGGSFEVTDSVPVQGDEYMQVTNRYRVKDLNSKEIQLTSTGQSRHKGQDIILAQRMTLNKRTGMPQLAHQYLQLGTESEIFSVVKKKEVEAPDVLREYESLHITRLYNVINVNRKNSDIGSIPEFEAEPYKSPTREELNQSVEQYLDSLALTEDELERPMLFCSGFHIYDKEPLKGAYVKAGLLKIVSKEDDTMSLSTNRGKESYFSPSIIGPYGLGAFESQPEVESYSLDLTVFVATETKKMTLKRKRRTQDEFEMDLSDSTVSLTYRHDGIRYYSPQPVHSIKFYNKNGNKVDARLIAVETTGLQKSDRYTAMELAKIYTDQDLSQPVKTISYTFEAEEVESIVLEAYTSEVAFKKTISRP